ncbi:zf-HC2 domain-containing protein [Marinobacteraceae bacterium S3BR75-40.1]
MQCHECIKQLDAYLDDDLSRSQSQALQAHVAECRACAHRLSAERQLLDTLRQLPADAPDDGFEARVLAAATGRASSPRRWSHTALATVAALALFAGVFIGIGVQDSARTTAPASMAKAGSDDYEVRTVKLAFDAQKTLDGVNLTLDLPPHVELAPFPGRHRVSWQVNLKAGENVLALPLRVLYPADGEIVAHLEHGDQTSSFRTVLPDFRGPSS